MLEDLQVSQRIHVIVGEGNSAQIHDLTWADIAQEGEQLADVGDNALKTRVENWLDMEEGALRRQVVNRPESGNIIIKAPNVYG